MLRNLIVPILIPAALLLTNNVIGQPAAVENFTIEEIRSELSGILDNEFDRVSDSDRISAVLVRAMNWIERRPELIQVQADLSDPELDLIRSLISDWLQNPNRTGDNRISRMCEVWLSSNYSGADRFDEALLAYEFENATGYGAFTEQRVNDILTSLETSLSPGSWGAFSAYIQKQVNSFSGKITHSFFTRTVRRMQSLETMELHCGR